MGRQKEVGDRFETSFYALGRIIASMEDEVTLYTAQATGQSGDIFSKHYIDPEYEHANGVYTKLN